ncbi:TPA: EcoAI/FtnUII family type I restriction enzme subunit R [Enterobacter soli]|uniref:EcoAI/FtnUII family type I restriction enzme subunit R n=1 Tax=Citrobacter freundii TaxID=546 RepID=UPI0015EAB06E|nr:type I restriction endonuclease subunit R [Citrobacter freundii]QLX24486.1 DEAD/DEAH box helicase family protein [Citrobacter freundii]
MNEAETRAEHIDPMLTAAGWGSFPGSRIRREYLITLGRLEGNGKRGKALSADYVLEYRNTKLAVIEAKAWDKPLTSGVAQAKDYASKLTLRYAYSSNGQGIYAIDMETGKEETVLTFPTPDELWQATFMLQNQWWDRFTAVPFQDKGGYWQGRYYQDIAIERVLRALAEGQDRILLTLATGTGKTFIAFQLAWKLFHSRWNLNDWKQEEEPTRRPRILFLADRNILANQAFNDFSAFPEDALVRISPDEIKKKGKAPKNGNIFFTIFQTFMTGTNAEGNPSPVFGDYPPDFFDLIIIDECHRGGANDESNWRDILNYFKPAVQLGLTATPKRKDNVDTYVYFGSPVYTYSLKEGINDGFLTPFRVRQHATTLDEYIYTSDDQVVEGEVERGRVYTEKDFNRVIEITPRERKRIEIFMQEIDQSQKTIVFCATQEHALAVRDLINQVKKSSNPNYCHRVTADDAALGEQWLREFQDNEKSIPTILTTSQKLSTGVNARNVRNIVLMRPINSMIEFKQIIGRGTRLYEGKNYFTIHDFVKAHHHFSDPEWDGESLPPEECEVCSTSPCSCEKPAAKICAVCNQRPCECLKEPTSDEQCQLCGNKPCSCDKKAKIKIELADGKARKIQHMSATSFWHPDGTPMSATEFMGNLFGKLPEFFKDEDELRTIWSEPSTRKKLLDGLAEKGFGAEQLSEMQKVLEAEESDLFDVLAYVAYASEPLTRQERAVRAETIIGNAFSSKQHAFLSFVLGHYVKEGVAELDETKLGPLLKLKYNNALADAFAELGSADVVRDTFIGFQKYLYQSGGRESL